MKNKIAKIIIFCFALLIGIALTTFLSISVPEVAVSLGKDYPFEYYYDSYKEYADLYIKEWDESKIVSFRTVNGVEADIDEDSIDITIDGEVCKLIAEYPIKFVDESNGYKDINISYENVKYQEFSYVKDIPETATLLFATFGLSSILSYCFIDIIYDFINWIIIKVKNKKAKH